MTIGAIGAVGGMGIGSMGGSGMLGVFASSAPVAAALGAANAAAPSAITANANALAPSALVTLSAAAQDLAAQNSLFGAGSNLGADFAKLIQALVLSMARTALDQTQSAQSQSAPDATSLELAVMDLLSAPSGQTGTSLGPLDEASIALLLLQMLENQTGASSTAAAAPIAAALA